MCEQFCGWVKKTKKQPYSTEGRTESHYTSTVIRVGIILLTLILIGVSEMQQWGEKDI